MRTGCDLLLDVNNIFVSATRSGLSMRMRYCVLTLSRQCSNGTAISHETPLATLRNIGRRKPSMPNSPSSSADTASDSKSISCKHLPITTKAQSPALLGLQEYKKICIHCFRMGRAHTVRSARIDLQCGILYDRGRQATCIIYRHDLIVIAVKNECRHINLLKIARVVHFRKLLDAVILTLDRSHHALRPKRIDHTLRRFCCCPIVAIERHREVPVKLRAVVKDVRANLIENVYRQTARVGRR